MAENIEVLFEPGEDRNYQATSNPEGSNKHSKIDNELLKTIAKTLKEATT